MQRLLPQKVMEKALDRRDGEFDGLFYVAIRTTGIFCRPSCPSRPARPENRIFFSTVQQALAAGFRPCKRCRPMRPGGTLPVWALKLDRAVRENPERRWTDQALRRLGIDPARARRFFRRRYGMTFLAYARSRRMGSALLQLKNGARLDRVALANGFDSHSGFREAFARVFAEPPGRARSARCIIATWMESPLGPLLAGSLEDGIVFLEFSETGGLKAQLAALGKRFEEPIVPGEHELLEQLGLELKEYFAGALQRFSVPVHLRGTPFQREVWQALLRIPYGQTCSYEDIAREVGSSRAVRAVGSANGCNNLAIIVPCHRVVNKNGKLGGYGGGLWRKQFLLDLERGESNDVGS